MKTKRKIEIVIGWLIAGPVIALAVTLMILRITGIRQEPPWEEILLPFGIMAAAAILMYAAFLIAKDE